ncbi:MAG: hypothetical protein GY859_23920 [Desulfobacterales bacterium]|nr:hypothetical protein [Desulfobacterales bacterium]
MAYNESDDSVTLEVQSRLDDIFGDLDEPEEGPEETPTPDAPPDDPLMDLKSLLLSIEWEITDEVMTQLVTKIDGLKERFKKDRILLLFLQLLRSLSNYIKSNKGGAHPTAFQILNSVFSSLEKVTASQDMTDPEKKRFLLIELKKFKDLKEQIALRKPVKKPRRKAPPPPMQPVVEAAPTPIRPAPIRPAPKERKAAAAPAPPGDPVLAALEEIKQIIKSEFNALRKELALLKKGG